MPRPLAEAVADGNVAIAALLLANGAAISEPDDVLAEDLNGDNLPMLRLLVEHGAKVNARNGNCPALGYAVLADDGSAVAFLLQHGANPNSYGYDQRSQCYVSILTLARTGDHLDQIEPLLRAGATINGANIAGSPTLFVPSG